MLAIFRLTLLVITLILLLDVFLQNFIIGLLFTIPAIMFTSLILEISSDVNNYFLNKGSN